MAQRHGRHLAVTLPAFWTIEDNPACHRVAKLGKSVRHASGDEQKITLGKGNRLVAHLEFSAALGDNIALITGMWLLQIHPDRPVQLHLQTAPIDRRCKEGRIGTGNGGGGGPVVQFEGALKCHFSLLSRGSFVNGLQNSDDSGLHLFTKW